MENSKIEWTDHTFNPWWGCTKVSPACEQCYAEAGANRWGFKVWGPGAKRRFLSDDAWRKPRKWNQKAQARHVRARVFCASMADVFEDRPDLKQERERLWRLIEATPWLDWLLLTKRPENIGAMVPWTDDWPCNVWLGATVENQKYAESRLPHLLKHPAAVRFLSCEPVLGRIDLTNWFERPGLHPIDWVISGGESGRKSRPSHPDWFRSLRDQCLDARVSYFFKQWGNLVPADCALPGQKVLTVKFEGEDSVLMARMQDKDLRILDGRTWDETPIARSPSIAAAPGPR